MTTLINRDHTREEIANAITHGLGALLAVAALVVLVVMASLYGTVWHIVSFAIFGSTLIILYLSSTLYHSFTGVKTKQLFRKFDHMSIYLLIAGTYTPFCLTVVRGWIGWTLFGLVWGFSILGVTLKAFYTGKREVLSTVLYIGLGWLALIAGKPLYDALSLTAFILAVGGGVFYTAGTYFFLKEKIRYNHAIWHSFVIAGSTCHFFAVLSLL